MRWDLQNRKLLLMMRMRSLKVEPPGSRRYMAGTLLGIGLVFHALTAVATPTDKVLLLEEHFSEVSALCPDTWMLEGTGEVDIVDGKLFLREHPDGVGAVLWLREEWPEHFTLTFEVSFSNNTGIGVVFIAAQGKDGSDALAPAVPRTGAYDEYIRGDLDSYSLSFHRYWPDGRNNPGSNLRRNSGFHLLHQALPDPCLEANTLYHFEIRKSGAEIEVSIDGKTTHKATDPGTWGAPLGSGKIGFRLRGDPSCVMVIDSVRITGKP